jgi:hypothetical protein
MKNSILALGLLASTIATPAAFAVEGRTPAGIPGIQHVFVIMMENHGYAQIIGNPNAPFINQYVGQANAATNYFAVAHPSLTNYLEIVGGSNFGVLNDNSPDWHNASCTPNIAQIAANGVVPTTPTTPGTVENEANGANICPIAGTGTDAATPVLDLTNETTGLPGDINIDGTHSYAPLANVTGATIADQINAVGETWKTYQENITLGSADKVNNANGIFSNLTNYAALSNNTYNSVAQITSGGTVALYAVKHNPFAYFASIQSSPTQLANIVGFEQLYTDLAKGTVPNLSFIVPNQCHDQHGKGGDEQACLGDADDNGTQVGLNPGLIQAGDITVQKLVTAIHASPAWSKGKSAIVLVWDENDYYTAPETNKVVLTVDTNYGAHGKTSTKYYNSFSLTASIEGALGLPCLNHACDSNTAVMTDLFGTH